MIQHLYEVAPQDATSTSDFQTGRARWYGHDHTQLHAWMTAIWQRKVGRIEGDTSDGLVLRVSLLDWDRLSDGLDGVRTGSHRGALPEKWPRNDEIRDLVRAAYRIMNDSHNMVYYVMTVETPEIVVKEMQIDE